MKQLFFRADGNAQIGMGHVMRCLALADMLKNDFTARFATVAPTQAVRTLLEKADLEVVALADETEFPAQIDPNDVVVLDGYSFDETAQRAIRNKARKLAFIDDLAAGHQVADVVINHAGGISPADYDAEAYTRFCLGPHYALLRPAFLRPAGFGLPLADGPIFVSLGGADSHNRSLMVLDAIRQVDATLAVRLVLGPFHPDRPAIEAFVNQLPNLTVLQNLTAEQMVGELTRCSLAITACSTIAYEVCAVNRPLIAIVTADNQARLATFMATEKLALSVNFPELLRSLRPPMGLDTALKLAIQSFQFMPDAVAESLLQQRRFFDGQSPVRFRQLFHDLTQ